MIWWRRWPIHGGRGLNPLEDRAAAAHFGCCVLCCVVVFVLKFNSYASPTHPPYVQDYCEVTGPRYGVTVIMITVKEGSQ